MSKFVLDRINRQVSQSEERQEMPEQTTPTKVYPPALSSEDLREIFGGQKEAPLEKTEKRFSGIEEFVEWYLPLKGKFTDAQNVPLTSLVQVRDMIFVGCACKSAHRRNQANEYFRTFWIENSNRKTDLPNKIMEVGNFSKVTFLAPAVGEFLVLPTQ